MTQKTISGLLLIAIFLIFTTTAYYGLQLFAVVSIFASGWFNSYPFWAEMIVLYPLPIAAAIGCVPTFILKNVLKLVMTPKQAS